MHRPRAALELALTANGRDSITAAATAKALLTSDDSSAGLTEDSDLQSIKAEPTTPRFWLGGSDGNSTETDGKNPGARPSLQSCLRL